MQLGCALDIWPGLHNSPGPCNIQPNMVRARAGTQDLVVLQGVACSRGLAAAKGRRGVLAFVWQATSDMCWPCTALHRNTFTSHLSELTASTTAAIAGLTRATFTRMSRCTPRSGHWQACSVRTYRSGFVHRWRAVGGCSMGPVHAPWVLPRFTAPENNLDVDSLTPPSRTDPLPAFARAAK